MSDYLSQEVKTGEDRLVLKTDGYVSTLHHFPEPQWLKLVALLDEDNQGQESGDEEWDEWRASEVSDQIDEAWDIHECHIGSPFSGRYARVVWDEHADNLWIVISSGRRT